MCVLTLHPLYNMCTLHRARRPQQPRSGSDGVTTRDPSTDSRPNKHNTPTHRDNHHQACVKNRPDHLEISQNPKLQNHMSFHHTSAHVTLQPHNTYTQQGHCMSFHHTSAHVTLQPRNTYTQQGHYMSFHHTSTHIASQLHNIHTKYSHTTTHTKQPTQRHHTKKTTQSHTYLSRSPASHLQLPPNHPSPSRMGNQHAPSRYQHHPPASTHKRQTH